MTALVTLAWRLALTGGARRIVVVLVGNGVATALLLATAAVPSAIYPAGTVVDPAERASVTAALTFSLLPAVVLLLTASRTSAAVRDRRLASFRLLGVSLRRTAILACLENGMLGLAGSVAGLALFLATAPLVEALVAAGPGWFRAPFTTGAMPALAVVLTVTLLTAGIATVSLRRLTRDPIAQRSEATRRDPSLWRLTLLLTAVAPMALLAAIGRTASWLQSTGGLVLLVAGAMAGAIAIAQVTPLVSAWLARLLIRGGSTPAVLAGRAIQTEPGGTARLVSGLGVAVYLALAALAVLSAYESTPQYQFALQTIREGPQPISVGHQRDGQGSRVAPLTREEMAALSTVPGVRAVVPGYETSVDDVCAPEEACFADVFVGTCAQLAEVMVARGCSDDTAAVIAIERFAGTQWGWDAGQGELDTATSLDIRFSEDGPPSAVTLGAPIMQDSAATQALWVYQSSYNVFVPQHIADAADAHPLSATVIADGGLAVQQAVARAAPPGVVVEPYPLWDYDSVMRVRALITTLCAVVIGLGMLSLAMTTVDRAVDRRRSVARQIAIGIPPRVLRGAQLLETLVPLGIAVTLATGLGALMVRAWAALAEWPPLADGVQLGLVASASLIGAVLVSLSTLPLIRTRITPDLLRRE
ncbi:ABC transporter permease [Actinotalea subterranea]|uniref:ABC transporter permease n=1 Tax=Actinotalea subterranea TaxID=2607497 RepID=UPI0011ECA6EC|nr:ABC transporter permease [Actinotalea subterranea]